MIMQISPHKVLLAAKLGIAHIDKVRQDMLDTYIDKIMSRRFFAPKTREKAEKKVGQWDMLAVHMYAGRQYMTLQELESGADKAIEVGFPLISISGDEVRAVQSWL